MDLKQIIKMHIQSSNLNYNLEFFKDKYPEEYQQAKEELAKNDRSNTSVGIQSGNVRPQGFVSAFPETPVYRDPTASGTRGRTAGKSVGTPAQ